MPRFQHHRITESPFASSIQRSKYRNPIPVSLFRSTVLLYWNIIFLGQTSLGSYQCPFVSWCWKSWGMLELFGWNHLLFFVQGFLISAGVYGALSSLWIQASVTQVTQVCLHFRHRFASYWVYALRCDPCHYQVLREILCFRQYLPKSTMQRLDTALSTAAGLQGSEKR